MGCGMSTEADISVDQTNHNKSHSSTIITANPITKKEDTMTNSRSRWIKARNDQIESVLNFARNRTAAANSIKLLLLGAGESGKSTVLKQMRLIHGSGFTEQELAQYARVIWSDAVQSMRILIAAADRLGIWLDSHNPESLLYGYRQLVMETDPLRMYEEDLIALERSSSQRRKSSITSNGSSHELGITAAATGPALANNNFLEDYVLKYDRRKFNSPTYEFTGDDYVGSDNGLDAGVTTTMKSLPGASATSTPRAQIANNQYYKYSNHAGANEGLLHQESSPTAPALASKRDVAVAISELWKHDRGITAVFARSNEFQLEVNASHYFARILAYSKPGYRVTEQDILLGRIKTTGINETVFHIKNRTFRVFDVGGQRSERRKWIHCFDDVTALIFVAAVSEYDEVLFEDEWTNRMREALSLFESICQSRWFHATPIILFLNKIDILKRKLARPSGAGATNTTVTTYFPDYAGDPHNFEQVIAYFKSLFLAKNQNRSRKVYVHETLATDTTQMKFVIAAVTDSIIQKTLMDSGIL
jgi:guanine nucleotide-binding protein subunit alpha